MALQWQDYLSVDSTGAASVRLYGHGSTNQSDFYRQRESDAQTPGSGFGAAAEELYRRVHLLGVHVPEPRYADRPDGDDR